MTRRLTSLAMFAAALAMILVVAAAGDEDSGGSSDDSGWLFGLLLIFAPLVSAAAMRSVASSRLLRPVGGVAVPVCLMASAVFVGVGVDEQGAMGWAYGSPAVAASALLVAALLRGHDPRPIRVARGEGAPAASDQPDPVSDQPDRDSDLAARPPLDVMTPLGDAGGHATTALVAWLVVLVLSFIVSPPAFRALGWPTVERTLDARVIDIRPAGEANAVTFEARDGDRSLKWTYTVEHSNWELGERNRAYLGDDGKVHEDQQFGLAGIPLMWPVGFVAMFGAFAARRLWGLLIAQWDVSHGDDAPRLGFAAVIHDPAPKTWRPLLAVWDQDPTRGPRLAEPDAVYRADDETSEELESLSSHVVVRRAWIDTGMSARSKPRWVGFDGGVAVPHRRSVLGRRYVGVITRRSEVAEVVGLHHGPPQPGRYASPAPRPLGPSRHRLGPMVAWRFVPVVVAIAVAFLPADGGHPLDPERRSDRSTRDG